MESDNLSYEPMDVDLSSHSVNAMDISYTESNVDISIVKTEKLDICANENSSHMKPDLNNVVFYNIQNKKLSSSENRVKFRQQFLLITITFLLISILAFHITNFNCCENLNIDMLSHKLMTKLYGQSSAVKNIIKALESKESRKILVFYGSTGVGKTYTTSLMLESFIEHKNIYHYTMPSFLNFSSEFMLGLLFCKSATVVVDDLTKTDISKVYEPIKDLIIQSEKLSKNLTMILIYNCDMTDDQFLRKCDGIFLSDLKQSLQHLDAHTYFIKFETLTEKHLRKCIEDAQLDRKLSALDINKIVKNFNVTIDGCKGVHQKLQYFKTLYF